jgi:hypothetical protein
MRLYYVEVIIQNESEHFIQIDAFFEGEAKEGFSIQPNEFHIVPQYFHPEDRTYVTLFEEYWIDSVTIKFNNERIIIQSCGAIELAVCPDIERNILLFEIYYEYEELGRKEGQYTYFIAEEDYNRALPMK